MCAAGNCLKCEYLRGTAKSGILHPLHLIVASDLNIMILCILKQNNLSLSNLFYLFKKFRYYEADALGGVTIAPATPVMQGAAH